MQLFILDSPLEWGTLDLPLLGISSDWHGKTLSSPIGFALATDPENLWFVATHQAPASPLPNSEAGKFTPGLWEWDVAEFFLADAAGKEYLEFNIAPNGAWWAAKFSGQREASAEQPDFESEVRSYCDISDPNAWIVAIAVPLGFLKKLIDFGPGSRGNATFILNSPQQTFHTAARLPGDEPDFHQPADFPKLIPTKLPSA